MTYGWNVSQKMKAVGHTSFQFSRKNPMGIKSENAKSIFHGWVMQMGAHSQHFPGEAGRSPGRGLVEMEQGIPRWRWGRLFPLLQSCIFPHPEMMFRLGSDSSCSVCFGECFRRVGELLAQQQPHRFPVHSQVPAAHTHLQRDLCAKR